MSYATLIPEVVNKIVSIIPVDEDEYWVSDGPPGQAEEQQVILIGFTFDEDKPNISVEIDTNNGLGRCQEREEYTIACSLFSWSGDDSMEFHRERALKLFKIVRKAIKQNSKLDGLAMDCRISDYEITQAAFPQGKGVYIDFNITVMVFVGFVEDEEDE